MREAGVRRACLRWARGRRGCDGMVWGLTWLLASAAWAGPPTRVAARVEVAPGPVKRFALASDEGLLVGVTSNGKVVSMSMSSWAVDTASPCTVRSVAVEPDTDADAYRVWAGCEDGTVRELRWESGTMSAARDDDGVLLQWTIAQNPLEALVLAGDGLLYGVAEAAGDALRIHDLNPDNGDTNTLTTAIELARRGFREAALVGASDTAAGTLVVAHGGNEFSQVALPAGTPTNTIGAAINLEIDDMTVGPYTGGYASGVYIADPDRGLVQWSGNTGVGQLQPFTILNGTLDGLHALTVTYDSAGTSATGIVMQVGSQIRFFSDATTEVGPTFGSGGMRFVDMVEGPYGYVLAGSNTGEIAILTDAPWIDRLTLSADEVEEGDVVRLSFRTDDTGSYEIRRGGGRGRDGVELASGTVSEAGTVAVDLTVDSTWVEGTQALWVFQTNSDVATGHDRVDILVDNAPKQVGLSAGSVGFADEALVVEFSALDAPDITEYVVYLATTPFSASDYPTGGPESTVAQGVKSPRRLDASTYGGQIKARLAGLDNYVSYYLAVRAVDADGTEGPMSDVIQGMPRPTLTSGEALGEAGGGPSGCRTSPGGSAALGLAGLAAVALRRRRGVLAAVALLAAGQAQAQDTAPQPQRRGLARYDRDITPTWASFELRHDFQQLEQDALRAAYNPWVSVVRLEAGPSLFQVLELDLGLGFMTRKGYEVDDSLTRSADQARMQWFPLSLGATGRLHIIDDQPFVPYAGAGIDWIFYREDALDTEGAAITSSRLTGSKQGWHWHAGGNILLDLFAPARAAKLEALTGINDTWLTLEFRDQTMKNDGGFDFSGWAFSLGLRLDY